jgi:hypothetical protein
LWSATAVTQAERSIAEKRRETARRHHQANQNAVRSGRSGEIADAGAQAKDKAPFRLQQTGQVSRQSQQSVWPQFSISLNIHQTMKPLNPRESKKLLPLQFYDQTKPRSAQCK